MSFSRPEEPFYTGRMLRVVDKEESVPYQPFTPPSVTYQQYFLIVSKGLSGLAASSAMVNIPS